MTAMLSSKELASIYTRLEAPVVVADLLDRASALSDDESFALTILISEMKPEEALISLACCMQIIASRIEGDPALTSSLSMQANFILDDYGPLWLQRQAHPHLKTDDWSVYMQEDFEAAADLLMLCTDIFGHGSAAVAEVCSVLQDQARAHAEALDADLPAEIEAQIEQLSEIVYGGNVVPFPSSRRG